MGYSDSAFVAYKGRKRPIFSFKPNKPLPVLGEVKLSCVYIGAWNSLFVFGLKDQLAFMANKGLYGQ